MLHRRPWFLLFVFFLSLALGAIIFVSFKPSASKVMPATTTPTISVEAYRKELSSNVETFFSSYTGATDDQVKSTLVQSFLNQLLHMRVPAEDKELHLELALSLQQMKEGLQNHSQDAADGLLRLRLAVTKVSWLKL